MINHLLQLTCPVVRPARSADATGVADVLLNCDSIFIRDVFGVNVDGARSLLIEQYTKHYQGVHVLTEGEEIIGVMKLHLPGVKMGKTVSLYSLMRHIGIINGIKAGILISHWDEYKLKNHEAYIEYLSVKNEWKGLGCENILLERAQMLSHEHNAIYLSKFEPLRNYIGIGRIERNGFEARKKIRSPLAHLFGVTSVWRKYTVSVSDIPVTRIERVIHKLNLMKSDYRERRRESYAALKVSLIMMVIPITGGTLAAVKGNPLSATAWFVLIGAHLFGAMFLFREIFIGKYLISIAVISESSNLMYRALALADNWFDRGWLIPLALMNVGILMSVMRTPKVKELKNIEEQTNTIIAMNDIISKGKISI